MAQNSSGMRWPGLGATVALAIVVANLESGALDGFIGYSISALIVALAAVPLLRGGEKRRRMAELYLWLAFIFSMHYSLAIADALATASGLAPRVVFQAVSVAHLLLVVAALGVLGAWEPSPRDLHRRLASGFLVLGAAVFWIGARTFPGTSLEQVQGDPAGHRWTSLSFMIAAILTLIGLFLLAKALQSAGDTAFSGLGVLLFSFGAVFWVLHLIYRLTVLSAAAEAFSEFHTAPAWFGPWREWAGWLFGAYSVLAYLALVFFGIAIRRTGLAAPWLGWTLMLAGLLAAPLGGLPLFIHIPVWMLGVEILRAVGADRPS